MAIGGFGLCGEYGNFNAYVCDGVYKVFNMTQEMSW